MFVFLIVKFNCTNRIIPPRLPLLGSIDEISGITLNKIGLSDLARPFPFTLKLSSWRPLGASRTTICT